MTQKICLILTLLMAQLGMAESFGIESLKPNPSGYTSYSPNQQNNLVRFIKQCRVDKKDLVDIKDSHEVCRKQLGKELQLWQRPEGAITLGILIFITGGIAGSNL